MPKRKTNADLQKEIEALRERIEELERQPKQEVHHHYPAQPPVYYYTPPYYQTWPWTTCGAGTISESNVGWPMVPVHLDACSRETSGYIAPAECRECGCVPGPTVSHFAGCSRE